MRKTIEPIAHMRCAYTEKFGIPRQSGLVDLAADIVLEPKYKNPDALRGIEGFSHLWLIWGFSENREQQGGFTPTVRPPRLGGNKKMGVFATRSPYRPNGLGLSCVKLVSVGDGVITVSGADLANGTPIYDIKPYLAYTDSRPAATGGFAEQGLSHRLEVRFEPSLFALLPAHLQGAAAEILAQDPRPAYQSDTAREYGLTLEGYNIKFTVSGKRLTVTAVEPA